MDVGAEEATLGKLNQLLEKFPKELADPEKQKTLCIIMSKKMHEGHEIRTDMMNLGRPTVLSEWIRNYRQTRAKARQYLKNSNRYLNLTNTDIGKRQNIRDNNKNQNDHDGSNRNNLKKQKRLNENKNKNKPVIDWTIDRCRGCGKTGHEILNCWLCTVTNPHKDRNTEPVAFHKSTKGMQWIADTVHGPLCHPNWHLDGSKRETTEPKANQSKFETIFMFSH
jgi:hypothetical protein